MPTKEAPAQTPAATSAISGRMIVVHYCGGKLLKGTTQDFAPNKEAFHVYEDGDETAPSTTVCVQDLKAIFFVKSFEGDATHDERYNFDRASGHGRKAEVTFEDGEKIAGFTMGYHEDKPGFFLIPAEPDSNNSRIYIVNEAVKEVKWVKWL